MKNSKDIIQGEPMDLLHTVALKEMYPIVSCLIQFSTPINVDRLKQAIELVGKQIPEIFCSYNPSKNQWVYPKKPYKIIELLNKSSDFLKQPINFLEDSQLKIFIKNGSKPTIYIVMNHMLTDGSGFKQFLYLLADSYNQQQNIEARNDRSCDVIVESLLKNKYNYRSKMNLPNHSLMMPFTKGTVLKRIIDYVDISKENFLKIHQKAKLNSLTINDVIMASYIIEIAQRTNLKKVPLPCPADLRQFAPQKTLSIANLTGEYSLLISVDLEDDLTTIAKRIHQQMISQKKQRSFLQAIPKLRLIYHKLPTSLVRWIISKNYHVQSVSYTNFGILNSNFYFKGSPIEHCTLTGSFRKIPQFQVAVSTYMQKCTLSFCMIGDSLNQVEGHGIISNIISRLEKWSKKR